MATNSHSSLSTVAFSCLTSMAIGLTAVENATQSNLSCCYRQIVVNPWRRILQYACGHLDSNDLERFKKTDLVHNMEALIAALSSAKSADEIETALSSSNVNETDFTQGSDSSTTVKDDLKAALEKVLENEAILTTAKLRRRVKRFQQSLDAVEEAPEVVETKQYAVVEVKQHSCPEESIAALTTCRSYFDLAREMNNLCLPGDQEGGVKSKVFSEYRLPMKDVLKRLVDTKGMTNKPLRRRVNRLIFVLSTEEEQADELAAVKAKAAMAAVRNLTAKKVRPAFAECQKEISGHSTSLTAAPSVTPVTAPVLSKFEAARYIADCISGIRSAKDPADVERVINALPSGGFGDSETLRDLLNTIIENPELVNNAKLRRRVKRLIDTLMGSNTSATTEEVSVPVVPVTDSEAYVPSSSSKYDKKIVDVSRRTAAPQWEKEKAIPLHIPSTDSAIVTPIVPPPRVITGSFAGSLKLLEVAASTAQVEEAISDLCAESEGDDEIREAVRVRLEQLFADDSVVNNSKLRRRVKRLIDILAPLSVVEEAVSEVKSAHTTALSSSSIITNVKKAKRKKKTHVKKEDVRNPPCGPSLNGIIAEASTARTSDALASVLSAVTGESGSCATRRTLKRILERVMKDDSCLSGQMTAQNRRKLRRVADILSPRPAIPLIVPLISQTTF